MYDLFIDNVGFPPRLYELSEEFLKPKGAFVQVGMAGTASSMVTILRRMAQPTILGGVRRRFHFTTSATTTEYLNEIGKLMVEGKARSVIDEVFDFENVPAAFAKLRRGRAKGKIVIRVARE